MKEIPLTADSPQDLTFTHNEERLTMTLFFLPVASGWFFDLYSETKQKVIANGVPLVAGIPILYREPVDYVLFVDDLTGNDIDPFSQACFESRCKLYIEDKTKIDQAIQQTV